MEACWEETMGAWFDTNRNRSSSGARRLALAGGFLLGTVAGCGTRSTFEFDELDLVPAQEELTEFSLGRFTVPIPEAHKHSGSDRPHGNQVQFEFELHALVTRDQHSRIAEAWERHQGKFRDRVIRACRNSSLDDLQELKAHLMDAVQAQLGNKEVRQLLITDVKSEQL